MNPMATHFDQMLMGHIPSAKNSVSYGLIFKKMA
jgi:hypothetical protein